MWSVDYVLLRYVMKSGLCRKQIRTRTIYWWSPFLTSGLPISVSVNWTFFARCYGWGATSDLVGSKSAISLQQGLIGPKFQVDGIVPHQPFFFSENEAKWSFVRYKNLDRFFFRFVTMHAFDRRRDRRTDRILIARPRLHSMQRGKNCVLYC